MKKMVIFGGTSGLGQKLVPLLKQKYEVISLGSKDVDVTEWGEVKYFFLENEVDIVLNMFGKSYDMYLGEINEDELYPVYDAFRINTQGHVNVLSCALPELIKRKYGRIIGLSSVLSEMNIPKASLYSASKAFMDRLYSSANKENIRYGITCNTIQLGYWDGGMCERLEPNFREKVKKSIGLKRWGSIEELKNTIDFIINNEYLCGQNIKLDGGL